MRTINSTKRFAIGNKVKVIKPYILGSVLIDVGKIGTIVGGQLIDLPDMMLWNIRVWDVDFNGKIISAAESIIKEHMRLV